MFERTKELISGVAQFMRSGGMQAFFDSDETINTSNPDTYETNIYGLTNYESKLEIIYRGYMGELVYGSSGIRNVVDYRRSWIIGKEVSVTSTDKKGQEYLDSFFESTNISNFYRKLGTYGELEGKWVVVLKKNLFNQIIPIILPYKEYKYTIERNSFDVPETLIYTVGTQTVRVSSDSFIYCELSQSINCTNPMATPPSVSFSLKEIIRSDYNAKRWEQINDKYAKNTNFFKTKDWPDANKLANAIKGKSIDLNTNKEVQGRRFRLGDSFAAPADMSILGIDASGIESLKAQIINDNQTISGMQGIPIYLLGYPELMSNRSTGIEMAESIRNKTLFERSATESAIKEMYQKMVRLHNKLNSATIDPNSINVFIPVSSMIEQKLIMDTFSTLRDSGAISNLTLWEMLPDIDPELEKKRLEEQKLGNVSMMTNSLLDAMAEKDKQKSDGGIIDEDNIPK